MINLRGDFEALKQRFLDPCSKAVEEMVKEALQGVDRIDRVTSRVKSIDRFVAKASKLEDGKMKYSHPCTEIQDLIGVRAIVLFLEDVKVVSEKVGNYFRRIEARDLKPENTNEFSYFGWHAVLFIPDDCKPRTPIPGDPKYFELQVKTVFQHAWSETEHDLGYKPMSGELDDSLKRNVAFAASLAWGADRAFQDVRDSLLAKGAPHS